VIGNRVESVKRSWGGGGEEGKGRGVEEGTGIGDCDVFCAAAKAKHERVASRPSIFSRRMDFKRAEFKFTGLRISFTKMILLSQMKY
jgi:hypothetical protein